MEQEQPVTDRKDLKIQALLERISAITAQYENQDAERRVEITFMGARIEELEKELAEAKPEADTSNESD